MNSSTAARFSSTSPGRAFLSELGVDCRAAVPTHGFCRPCLDWSERRPHLGGALGKALLAALVRQGWARRPAAGRAVEITPPGLSALHRHFGLTLPA